MDDKAYLLDVRCRQLLYVIGHKDEGLPPGGFYEKLLEAGVRADKANLALMATAFPHVAKAVEMLHSGELNEQYITDRDPDEDLDF